MRQKNLEETKLNFDARFPTPRYQRDIKLMGPVPARASHVGTAKVVRKIDPSLFIPTSQLQQGI